VGPPLLDEAAVAAMLEKTARDARERLDREQRQLNELVRGGFTGADYDRFHNDLWTYAMPVIKGSIRNGEIFIWCRDKGIPVSPTSDEREVLHSSIEDRDGLAVDTIAGALDYFRDKVLRKERWTATGGSAVRTYFIGACLFEFQGVYRRWARERAVRLDATGYSLDNDAAAAQLLKAMTIDTERSAITGDTLARILAKGSPHANMICRLILQDYTYAEIGEQLGITERAVEGHMHRLRKRVAKMVERGQIEHPAPLRAALSSERAA